MLTQHREDHNQLSSDRRSPKPANINWVDSSLSAPLSAVIDHSALTDSDAFYGKRTSLCFLLTSIHSEDSEVFFVFLFFFPWVGGWDGS